MPSDPRDWLPEGHLAWFVLASVEEMDLSAFYGSYRQDGWGRAAFEPSMMVALLLYPYARGERSSRGIERRCVEDVAYRVIAAQQTPDHATIARFRVRHDYEQLAREILKEAGEVDAAEDELYGDARGDELPEHLRTREGRRAALRAAKEKLTRERADREDVKVKVKAQGVELVFEPEAIVARMQGREGWLREARHQLDEHRRLQAQPIPRSRAKRLLEAEHRLQENLRSSARPTTPMNITGRLP